MSEEYNVSNMPSSEHYYVGALMNGELNRVTYFAINKETNVPEVPFILASDAKTVLKDLESYYDKPKNDGKVIGLKTIQH